MIFACVLERKLVIFYSFCVTESLLLVNVPNLLDFTGNNSSAAPGEGE